MPSPFIITIAAFTLQEARRNRLLWLSLAALIAALGLAEFVGGIAITESVQTRSGFLGAGLRLFSVFLLALFVVTSMAREVNDKVIELLLSLPQPRAHYYLGKLLGFALLATVQAAIVGALLLLYAPPAQVGLWTLSLACELWLVAALSLLSMFTFNQVTAAFSTAAAFYVLARSIGALQLISHGPLIDPNSWSQRLMGWFIDGLAFVLPDLYRFAPSEWLIYHTGQWPALGLVFSQTAIYLTLLTAAGLFDLYRKNF
jgi:ABC-type transport system involved in multi-copper enzyme maturation permease subunit